MTGRRIEFGKLPEIHSPEMEEFVRAIRDLLTTNRFTSLTELGDTLQPRQGRQRLSEIMGRRQRNIKRLADTLHQALRQPHLRQQPRIEQALGTQALALLAMLNAAATGVEQLSDAVREAFHTHPDHKVITSFPGLGDLAGARLFGEIGDDRTRFTDARALRAYAGSAPVTRASGRSHVVTHRRIKNNRLATFGFSWAFMAITHSPPARAHYDRRRAAGDRHPAALRHLFNRYFGQLFHCLRTDQTFDPIKAFTTSRPTDTTAT